MAVPFTLSQVPAATPYVQYTATPGQTTFPYPFPITQDADLAVLVNGVLEPVDVGYSVTGVGNITGGNVVANSGLTAGTIVTIYRDIQIERITQLAQNGTFFSSNFNNEFNRLYLIAQQLEDATTFCLQVPNTNVGNPQNTTVLTPGLYANKYLAFDSNGNPTPAALTSSGSISAAIINSLIGAQTPAELAAGVTPVNEAYGQGDVRRYGADPTGVADSTTAIANALLVGESVYSVDGTYLLNGAGLIANVAFQHIYWKNALWQVGSSFSGGTVLQLGTNAGLGTGIRCHDPFIDGGFSQTGSGASTVGTPFAANLISVQGASVNIFNPFLTHFSGYGIGFVSTFAGDSWAYNPFITQWSNGDGPWANAANFTGDCIYFNRPDCWVDGGESRWAGKCVHFGPSAATCWLTGHHPYNGTAPWSGNPSASPMVDGIIIQIDKGANNCNIHDCYLDNGHVEIHAMNTSLRGCYFLQNPAAAIYSADASGFPTIVRVYNDNGRNHPFDLDVSTHNWYPAASNGTASALATRFITFLPGAPIAITGATGDGTHATVTFATQPNAATVGATVTIASMNPSGYNSVNAVVTAATATSVTYANATSSAFVAGGTLVFGWTGDTTALSNYFGTGIDFTIANNRVELAGGGSSSNFRTVICADTFMQSEYIASVGTAAGPADTVQMGFGWTGTGTQSFMKVGAAYLLVASRQAATQANISLNATGTSTHDDGSTNGLWYVDTQSIERLYLDGLASGSGGTQTFGPNSNNYIVLGSVSKGWAAINSVTDVNVTSDERVKTDIAPITSALAFVKDLEPVTFKHKEGGRIQHAPVYHLAGKPTLADGTRVGRATQGAVLVAEGYEESVPGTRTHSGFKAQQVRAVLAKHGYPDMPLVNLEDKTDANSAHSMRHQQLLAFLVGAIQELSAKVDALTPKA